MRDAWLALSEAMPKAFVSTGGTELSNTQLRDLRTRVLQDYVTSECARRRVRDRERHYKSAAAAAKEAERQGTTVDLSFPEMQAHVDPEAHGHWMEPYVLAALNAALGSDDGGGGEKKKKKDAHCRSWRGGENRWRLPSPQR